MWCFGLFDKPMASPSTPIYGSLRQRSTAYLQRRLDAARFKSLPVVPSLSVAAVVAAAVDPKQTVLTSFFRRSPP